MISSCFPAFLIEIISLVFLPVLLYPPWFNFLGTAQVNDDTAEAEEAVQVGEVELAMPGESAFLAGLPQFLAIVGSAMPKVA